MQKYVTRKVREMVVEDAVEGFYLLKSPTPRTTQNGKNYLTFRLADTSGEIEGIYWDYEGDLHDTCAGKPVKVRGTISEYNGKKQFNVIQIRAAKEDDPLDMNALIPTAPIDPKETYSQLVSLLDTIQDADYKKLCVEMLARNQEFICCIPAAKSVHHSFRYGLLMHTYFMMCHARPPVYGSAGSCKSQLGARHQRGEINAAAAYASLASRETGVRSRRGSADSGGCSSFHD